MGSRKIKKQILELLAHPDMDSIETQLASMNPKDAVNALFFGICRSDELVRWHAISGMGTAVARLAEADMEEGRIVMRRLLWSLNDESGGIGWGAPESLAEIMSQHEGLAREYVHMALSYMREDGDEIWQDGNYLEHEVLQQGLMWAAGRLAMTRYSLVLEKGMAGDLPPYLAAEDGTVRGLAARAIGLLGIQDNLDKLEALRSDNSSVRLYANSMLTTVTVGELADRALQRLVN